MYPVKTATAVTSMPAYTEGGTPGYFTSGNAVAGIPATVPGEHWFNMTQEELLNVIRAAGLTPSPTDDTQLREAILALIAAQAVTVGPASESVAGISKLATLVKSIAGVDDADVMTSAKVAAALLSGTGRTAVAGGTANALTATIPSLLTALVDGMMVSVRAAAANTIITPTFNLTLGTTATGAATIVRDDLGPLLLGDIPGAGAEVLLKYNSTANKWVLLNPAQVCESGSFTPTIYGGTTAGVGTYTWQQGWYRKIGSLVMVHIGFTWTGHTGSGEMFIGALPFAVSTGYGGAIGGALAHIVNALTVTGMAGVRAIANTSTAEVVAVTTSGAYSRLALDTAVNLFCVDFTYYTN